MIAPINDDFEFVDPAFNALMRLEPADVAASEFEFEPTSATPGSEEKIEVMQDRYDAGLPLFHPDDELSHIPQVPDFDEVEVDDEEEEEESDDD